MNDNERLARLRLIRTENVGPITYYKLLDRYGTAVRALEALPELSKRGGRAITACPKDIAEREIASVGKYGARLIMHGDADYPSQLEHLEDAPPVLTVMGNTAMLSKPSLAVVGARNASLSGKKIASDFTGKVAAAGFVIVSGLARGIDTAAHVAGLKTGTAAVVAGGIDVIYPPENEKLYRDIAAQGAIVAESHFGAEPVAKLFPKRNRIVAALSLGTLVIEAAVKSGSLITARLATELGRDVFAVPGSPLDPRAEGTNKLLSDGAYIATSSEDILCHLRDKARAPLRDSANGAWESPPQTVREPGDALRAAILENLSPVPVHIDELVRAVEAPVQDVLTVLLELELAGRAERRAGNRVCFTLT